MTTPAPPTTPSSTPGSFNPALLRSLTPRGSRFSPHSPTPKQIAALTAHNFLPDDEPSELLYGGSAGGGKSDWLLDGALEYVDVPGYAAIVFRRTYTDLALPGAIMDRSKQWLKKFEGHGVSWNQQEKTWTFQTPDGGEASLTFAYLRHADDIYRYQSAEFQYIGFDELTQFMESQYVYLFSRLRRPSEGALSRVPLRMRAASNPGGIGHGWVKKRFPIKPGETKGRRIFIPARLSDNPHVDAKAYTASLRKLSPALCDQLLEGNWDAFEGMAYPDIDETIHAVAPFPLTTIAHWARHEGMDHGVTNPTAWLLYLTDYDGNLIAADEYYAPGLPSAHAAEILERRREWWSQRDDDGWPMTHPCFGDPASLRESLPVADKLGQPLSLEDEYARLGLGIKPGNNRRRAGYVHVRELLEPSCACSEDLLRPGERCPTCEKTSRRRFPLWHPLAGKLGAPRLYVVRERCPELWDQLQNAPLATEELDPERGEAVDRKWESAYGHCHAANRYGLLSPERRSEEPETLPEDPRAAAIVLRQRKRAEDWKRKQRGGVGAPGAIDW